MIIDVSTLSNRGGRKKNQDDLAHHFAQNGGVFVVADGLGGHEGGEIASKLVCQHIVSTARTLTPLSFQSHALEDMISSAQSHLLKNKAEQPRYKDMCSTVTILQLGFVTNGNGESVPGAIWAHVGDSRIYHFRGGRLLSCTKDHSVPQALVRAGEIRAEDIRNHEDRNRLLRALGMDGDIKATVNPLIEIEEGDVWLLCTDGFWEYVTEPEMETLLAVSPNTSSWLKAMEQLLRSRTVGEYDNYSALAVRVSDVKQAVLTPTKQNGLLAKVNEGVKTMVPKARLNKQWLFLAVACLLVLAVILFMMSNKSSDRQDQTVDLKIGDYVQFGEWDTVPLKWRVIHKDDDGKSLLFSAQILTKKPFDIDGSNRYETSSLRQWLNSPQGFFQKPIYRNRIKVSLPRFKTARFLRAMIRAKRREGASGCVSIMI
jgi:serine/threonine protein phosphatase PrpC